MKKASIQISTALRIAAEGIPVAPAYGTKEGTCNCGDDNCAEPGVHPRREATTDPATIQKYWAKWPKAMITVATGDGNIIAVKGIPQVAGTWEKLQAEHGLPHTVEMAERGSITYFFKASPSSVPDGVLLIAENLAVFGKGAYIIAPTFDQTASDKLRFVAGKAFGDVEFAPLPGYLEDLIRLHTASIAVSRYKFDPVVVDFGWIVVPPGPCDPEKVTLLAESLKVTGIRTLPVLRQLKKSPTGRRGYGEPRYALLSDPHQLEAMKNCGHEGHECIIMQVDETGGRLWQIGELIHQPELSPLDWAELIMEWVEIVRKKDAQIGHPAGGRQPHDKGLARAGRVLGVSRSDMQRAEKIASISAAGKAAIRRLKLTIKQDLLNIFRSPPDEQVAKAIALAAPKGRVKPAAVIDPSENSRQVLASATPAVPPAENPGQGEDESHGRMGEVVKSPPTAPENSVEPEIPLALLNTDGEKVFEAIKARWVQYIEADWAILSTEFQVRFAREVMGLRTATDTDCQTDGDADSVGGDHKVRMAISADAADGADEETKRGGLIVDKSTTLIRSVEIGDRQIPVYQRRSWTPKKRSLEH
jgi:hypothetical protein